MPKDLHDTDVVIYGHSHKYAEQMANGVLWLNPGSCGKAAYYANLQSHSGLIDIFTSRLRQLEREKTAPER